MCTYQNPPEIEGVTIAQFAKHLLPQVSMEQVLQHLDTALKDLGLEEDFRTRFVHAGLSGGQKKLVELLQIMLVVPKLALLDEIDSGLDARKQVLAAKAIQGLCAKGVSVIVVTHSASFEQLLKPQYTVEL